MSAGGYELTTISWSAPADSFKNAAFGEDQYGDPLTPGGPPQMGKTSHDYVPLAPGDLYGLDAITFYTGRGAIGEGLNLAITCEVVVQNGDGQVNQTITVTQHVKVKAPAYSMLLIPGHSTLTGGASSPDGIYAGDTASGNVGMVMAYHVGGMPDFESGSDRGQYAMVQLLNYDEWQYRAGFSGKQDEQKTPTYPTDPYALDSSWPYGDRWYTPGVDIGQDSDSPGSQLRTYFIGYSTFFHAADDFADFIAYRPPTGISLGTEHVPLQENDWSWHCEDGKGSGGLWTDPPGMDPYRGGTIEFPLDALRWHECFQL